MTDFIKIRGSYGITGNDPAGFYDAYRALTTNVDYRGGSGITSYNGSGTIAYDFGSAVTSRELGWEESKQMNFGLDAHFLNKRIILTGDYYIRDSESMIFNYCSAGHHRIYRSEKQSGIRSEQRCRITIESGFASAQLGLVVDDRCEYRHE